MKRIIIITVIMCAFNLAYAQNDLIDKITKQAVEIDSLTKVLKVEIDISQQQKKINQSLKDTLSKLYSDLAKLEYFKREKKNSDSLIRRMTDSVTILTNIISEMEKIIVTERQKSEQQVRLEYEKGKNEILTTLLYNYKNKSFDELITTSTTQLVQRDLSLFENIPEVKIILTDLEIYFNAKELLEAKLDAAQINKYQIQLGRIKRESILLRKLKEMIGNYQTFTTGLKGTIEKIRVLDNKEAVSGMSKQIQMKKFDKILAELSSYVFNYDFNFLDFPYLSDIFLELIKRKQSNADADISDLLNKL